MPALRSPIIRVGHISNWHMQPLVCQSFSSVNDVTATWLPLNSSKRLLGSCLHQVVARRAWRLSYYQRWLIAIAGSVRPRQMQDIKWLAGYLTVPNILYSRALGYISSNYHDLTAVGRGFHASSYPARYYFVPSLNINWTAFAANSFSHTENVGGTAGPHVTVHQRYKQISLRSIVVFLGEGARIIVRSLPMPHCGACAHQRNHLKKPRFVVMQDGFSKAACRRRERFFRDATTWFFEIGSNGFYQLCPIRCRAAPSFMTSAAPQASSVGTTRQ